MSSYEDSIKCKYCSHFEPGVNRCHLYFDFDQSLDKHGGKYLENTSPDSRCSHFNLTAMDTVMKSMNITTRADGSHIVSLYQVPQLSQQLSCDKKSNSSNFHSSNKGSSFGSIFKWLAIGLFPSFIISFFTGAFLNTESFPLGIMILCLVIFGIIGYFFD